MIVKSNTRENVLFFDFGNQKKKLRHYMLAHTTYLISRMDPIKFLFEKARWHMLLSEFHIEFTTHKAGQAIADHLAEHAVEDYEPVDWDFPDEDIMAIEPETDTWKDVFRWCCKSTWLWTWGSVNRRVIISLLLSSWILLARITLLNTKLVLPVYKRHLT